MGLKSLCSPLAFSGSEAAQLAQNPPRLCENSEFGFFWRFSFLHIDPFVIQFDERGRKSRCFSRFDEAPIVFTQSAPFVEPFHTKRYRCSTPHGLGSYLKNPSD